MHQPIIKNNNINFEKPYYPSDFTHALLSSCSYMNLEPGDIVAFPDNTPKAKFNKYLRNWSVIKVFCPQNSDNYYSALYVNDIGRYAVLAHRGTKIKESIIGFNKSLDASLAEVLSGDIGAQQIAAYGATDESIKFLKDCKNNGMPYNFSITGHSLGAWLAELSLYFCHMNFNYQKAKTVCFDSPGTADHLLKLTSNIINKETRFDYNLLEITTYLSPPNLVNVCNRHIGDVYRIYPEVSDPVNYLRNFAGKSLGKFLKISNFGKNFLDEMQPYTCILSSLSGHGLNKILDVFDPETGLPIEYKKVLDWPLILHDKVDCKLLDKSTVKLKDLNPQISDLIINQAANIISGFVPNSTILGVGSVIAEFFKGNINLLQFYDSFKHLDLGTNEFGYTEKEIKTSKEDFELKYISHYKTKTFNPYKITLSPFVKGSTDWHLKKLIKFFAPNCHQNFEPKILEDLAADCRLTTSNGSYIIKSKEHPMRYIKNVVKNYMEHDHELQKNIILNTPRKFSICKQSPMGDRSEDNFIIMNNQEIISINNRNANTGEFKRLFQDAKILDGNLCKRLSLGEIVCNLDDLNKEVIAAFQKSLYYIDPNKSKSDFAYTLHKTGCCYDRLADAEKALQYYRAAHLLYNIIGSSKNEEAQLIHSIASKYDDLSSIAPSDEIKKMDINEAILHYNKALSMYKKLNNLEKQISISYSIGAKYDDLGQYTIAAKYYGKTLIESLSKNVPIYTSDLFMSLGNKCYDLGYLGCQKIIKKNSNLWSNIERNSDQYNIFKTELAKNSDGKYYKVEKTLQNVENEIIQGNWSRGYFIQTPIIWDFGVKGWTSPSHLMKIINKNNVNPLQILCFEKMALQLNDEATEKQKSCITEFLKLYPGVSNDIKAIALYHPDYFDDDEVITNCLTINDLNANEPILPSVEKMIIDLNNVVSDMYCDQMERESILYSE